jgi:hypothetical protein
MPLDLSLCVHARRLWAALLAKKFGQVGRSPATRPGQLHRNMPRRDINDPEHWCDRATAMRALATTMKDVETIAIVYRLADDCDKLADRAGQRQAYIKPSKPK